MSPSRPDPAMARRTNLRARTVGVAALVSALMSALAWAGAAHALTPDDMRARTAFIATRYLEIWSSNNISPVADVPYMYGPTVQFYGKPYTRAQLQAEKRRAIAQWPMRHYAHRPDTMRVVCNVQARKCAAQSTIDFTVANPDRRTGKSGSAKFDLGVSFAGPRPVILYEGGSLNRRRAATRTRDAFAQDRSAATAR